MQQSGAQNLVFFYFFSVAQNDLEGLLKQIAGPYFVSF